LVEAVLEIVDLLLELFDLLLEGMEALFLLLQEDAQGGLSSSGDLLPQFGIDLVAQASCSSIARQCQ
jgi:hypothetical protein